jgi:hypothetical protein
MRFFLSASMILLVSLAKAQDKDDSTFLFSGYIYSEDLVPVEHAYLINYRNTKIVTTDSKGRFSMSVQKSDSLMINHVSMEPLVIHPKPGNAASNIFYVKYRIYRIQTIFSQGDKEQKNLEENVQQLKTDLANLGLKHIKPPKGSINNPYNPDKTSEGLTVTLEDIFKLFRKKKKK